MRSQTTDWQSFACNGDALLKAHTDLTQTENQLTLALDQYYQALELDPDNSELTSKMAYALLKEASPKKAVQFAEKTLHQDNKNATAHYVLGHHYYHQGKLKTSEKHLNQAIKYGGLKTSRARLCLAYNYFAQSNKTNEKAGNSFQKIAKLLQGGLSFGLGALSLGFDDHPQELLYTLQLIPTLGKIQLKAESSPQDAIEELMALHQKFPGMASLMNMLGQLYQKIDQYPKAEYWFRRALERDPLYTESYENLADLLEETGDNAEALTLYKQLLAIKPNDWEVHCCLGNVYYGEGNYDKAKQYFLASLQLSDDNDWKALMAQSIARLYREIYHDLTASKQYLQMAIEFSSGNLENYIMLGILLFETGDLINAEILYKRALEHFPDNAQLTSSMGYLRWMKNDINSAVEYYNQALELDPLYEIAYNNLGVITLDHQGNVREAIHLFSQAIDLNDDYALAHYNLGRAQSLMGNKLEAASAYQRAQELNIHTHEIDEVELEDRLFQLFDTFEAAYESGYDIAEPLDRAS